MPNVALIPRSATRIPLLTAVVDGFPSTTHTLETGIGGEPLEDGRQVTDHAIAREEQLELTGFVSDFRGGQAPADAWEEIRRLHRELVPMEVFTEWGTYGEMLLRRCKAVQAGRGMRFTLNLHQVIRVGVTDLDLPSDALSNPRAVNEISRARQVADSTQRDAVAAGQSLDQASEAVQEHAAAAEQAQEAVQNTRESGDRLRGLRNTLSEVQDLREYPVAQTQFDVTRLRTSAERAVNATTGLQQAVSDGNILGAVDATRESVSRTQRLLLNSEKLSASIDRTAMQASGIGRSGQLQRGRVSL